MKYLLFIFILSTFFWACENNLKPQEDYLVGTWQSGTQTLRFYEDSNAVMIVNGSSGSDTMKIYYKFELNSSPMQLDMNIHQGLLKGMNTFGIIEILHRDTFIATSKPGFEGMGDKYRPKSMNKDSVRITTYARMK